MLLPHPKDKAMMKTIFHFVALTAAIAGLGAAFVMAAANAATPTAGLSTRPISVDIRR